ncbi:hypothetical protein BD779DRAFT_214278 [Infundibulicybe gibba]|nr:hypothetical protein BD779DRAFT_214278 [Infundibulicybe gibba]
MDLPSPPGGNQSWYTTTQLMLAAYSETTQAELANEEPVNVQSDHSPPEYMGSQTAASTPGNHEEYFPLSEYGFGDQAQYQDAVPYSAQEYQSPNNQPTPYADLSRPRTMLEELQSPFISTIGEDIYPSGEQATAGYESHSQSTFSLPTFRAASPQTLASEFSHGSAEGLVATHHAGSAATGEGISDEDMQAISSTLLSAVGGPMESHAILNFAMILANTDVPGSSAPQEAL